MEKCGGKCGEVCWGMGEVRGEVGGMGSSPHTTTYFPTSQHTFPDLSPQNHTFPYLPPPQHISPLLLPHFPTPSIFFPYLTQLLKLPKIPQLPHHPYSSKFAILLHSSPYSIPPPSIPHSYFIIYPYEYLSLIIAKLDHSPAIKCTRNSSEIS